MAWNVSNEVKVGAVTAISITLLILGFNFLKGNNPLKRSQYIYAKFESIEGLVPSNPIVMNGLVIGSVFKAEPSDEFLSSVLITIRLSEAVKIPKDSKAIIKGNLLSTPVVEIQKGIATEYLAKGDTLITEESSGFLGAVLEQLGPTQQTLNKTLREMDTLLSSTNRVLDVKAQDDLRQTLSNLSRITQQLAETSVSVNKLLQQQQNALTETIGNLRATSVQVKEGTQNLPAITKNLETSTKKLSELELQATVSKLNETLEQMNATLGKVNDQNGSVGALLNDRRLYDNLSSTVNSMNLLLQDLRLHPKRYVNVSVFGRKAKSEPLMRPMDEDSITQEQIRKQ